jgi:mannose-6-phosphate isomerase-like protein (cupin superfamily)
MDVRRVVTGHDSKGKSIFVSDDKVPPITLSVMPGAEFHRLWGGDEVPHFPDDGREPRAPQYFPKVGGFRFGFFTVPPVGQALPENSDVAAGLAELEEKLPGLTGHMERDDPGMHTTATIDFEVVLSGEIVLELDDGQKRRMRAGDTVVQNGTRHRWHNEGKVPAVLAVFISGARHDKVR